MTHWLTLVTPQHSKRIKSGKGNTVIMATNNKTAETHNDLIDLTNERVDNLAALITVTAEQMDDRVLAGEALESGAYRSAELVELVFGSSTPSVESYLESRDTVLQAA